MILIFIISRLVPQFSCSIMSNCLRPHRLQPARLLCPWNSPGKNSGVGSHALLQGIFLTQGSNLGLLHCRQILLQSEPPGKLILIIRKACIFYYFISDGRVGIMYSFVYGSCNTYFRRRQWQPTPVFLPRESQGQRSLAACHLWGRRVGYD